MTDEFDLARYVSAHDADGTYHRALAELRNGRKVSHWMWFVFPQIAGLGHSWTARHYALTGLDEAQAYLRHQILGPRLVECCNVVAKLEKRSVHDIFGGIDAMKLQSCVTLFSLADDRVAEFQLILDKYFEGELDEGTLHRLGSAR